MSISSIKCKNWNIQPALAMRPALIVLGLTAIALLMLAASSKAGAIPPESSVDQLPLNTIHNTFNVYYTASDDVGGSGIKEVELWNRINGGEWNQYGTYTASPISFTAGPEGVYEFYTRAWDNSFNYENAPTNPDTVSIVDQFPPTSKAGPLTPFSSSLDLDIPYLAADGAGSGVDHVELWWSRNNQPSLNYGSFTTSPISFTAVSEGSYTFYTRAVDKAGRVEGVPGGSDTGTVIDLGPPDSSVSSLGTYKPRTFDIAYTSNDGVGSGTHTVELWFSVDGGTWKHYGDPLSSPYSFTAPTDGYYEFYTRARDYAGNLEDAPPTSDAKTMVDTYAPITAANPSTTISTTMDLHFQVNYTATDNLSGVNKVEVWHRIDQSPWSYYADGMDGSIPYTALADGAYGFYTRGRDNAANYENAPTQADVVVHVDTLEPVSELQSLPSYSIERLIEIPFTASDHQYGSGLDHTTLYYREATLGGLGEWVEANRSTSSPFLFLSQMDGSFEFISIATDIAGNVESLPADPDTSTIIDTLPPEISNQQPNGTEVAVNSTIVATFSKPMEIHSIQTAFSLSHGTTKALGTFSWSGLILTFTPVQALEYDTQYIAMMDTTALDTSGISLTTAFIWEFTTELDPDTIDQDWDGIPDYQDSDRDGDGISDDDDLHPDDTDNDGVPNAVDNDDDGDGIPDATDLRRFDTDNDGITNDDDNDDDADDIEDGLDEYPLDTDNDGVTNKEDDDDDGDGIPDVTDMYVLDFDNDGMRNSEDLDDDGDLMLDYWENLYGLDPLDPSDAALDLDGDGLTNAQEAGYGSRPDMMDTDGDGVGDLADPYPTDATRGGEMPMLFWLVIGICIGLIGLFVFSYLHRPKSTGTEQGKFQVLSQKNLEDHDHGRSGSNNAPDPGEIVEVEPHIEDDGSMDDGFDPEDMGSLEEGEEPDGSEEPNGSEELIESDEGSQSEERDPKPGNPSSAKP